MFSKAILEELKKRLLAEKASLEQNLKAFAMPTGREGDFQTKFDSLGTTPDENASEVEDYVDNLPVEQSLEVQLKEIYGALERMGKEAYGFCEKCTGPISLERLRAYPAAQNCIKCAEK